ncbi:MAG: ribonuclease HII, partial [Mycobacterium sp.]|nr:ribonuclease HII [Mycobacterium sp.]
MSRWPPRFPIRRAASLRTYEFALHRNGLGPVAGVDEAGRGACAGPLVVAACVLKPTQLASLADLDDSKRLTEATREQLYKAVTKY